MFAENDEAQESWYSVSHGRVADFLLRFALPVVALPGQAIFRVVLHGYGFVYHIEGLPPRIGFYVTYFVASRSVRTAETTAQRRLRDRWGTFHADDAKGELIIETDEIERLEEWFLPRSRWGMAFYSSAD